jgi:hypothetical protein
MFDLVRYCGIYNSIDGINDLGEKGVNRYLYSCA